jgi:hypothetical protein
VPFAPPRFQEGVEPDDRGSSALDRNRVRCQRGSGRQAQVSNFDQTARRHLIRVHYGTRVGSGRVPVFQSAPDIGLSRRYHLKAVGCEKFAEHASDLTTEQQWHAMADRAAGTAGQTAEDEFE